MWAVKPLLSVEQRHGNPKKRNPCFWMNDACVCSHGKRFRFWVKIHFHRNWNFTLCDPLSFKRCEQESEREREIERKHKCARVCVSIALETAKHMCAISPMRMSKECFLSSPSTTWLNITKELISFLRLHITLDHNVCSIEIGNVVWVDACVHALLMPDECEPIRWPHTHSVYWIDKFVFSFMEHTTKLRN